MGFLRWLNMPITYIYFVVVVFAGASMVNNAIETAVPNEQIDWASGTVYFLMYSTMIYFFLRGVWGVVKWTLFLNAPLVGQIVQDSSKLKEGYKDIYKKE
jgi:hypothetical protein